MNNNYFIFCGNCGKRSRVHLDVESDKQFCIYCGNKERGLTNDELVGLNEAEDILSRHFTFIDEMISDAFEIFGHDVADEFVEREMKRLRMRTKEDVITEHATEIALELMKNSNLFSVSCSNCSLFSVGLSEDEVDTLYCPVCGVLNRDQDTAKKLIKKSKDLAILFYKEKNPLFSDQITRLHHFDNDILDINAGFKKSRKKRRKK